MELEDEIAEPFDKEFAYAYAYACMHSKMFA